MTWELWFRLKPVSANEASRMHWATKADLVKHYRHTAGWLAKSAKIPHLEHCHVELIIYPRVMRIRDQDNYVYPLLKSCADGIVDAGVVPDDAPAFMTKAMPRFASGPDPRGTFCVVVSE